MKSQTTEQNALASGRIEEILNGDLKDTVKYFIGSFGKTFERKLGLTKDDLLNDVREQIWKGLLTHKSDGKANLKTYLNKLIKNRFGVLHKRSTIKKYNSVDYYGDVFATTGIDEERLVTEETGESIFEQRQVIMQELGALSVSDRFIYADLIMGRSLDEITTLRKLPKIQVIATINKIDVMIKNRVKG